MLNDNMGRLNSIADILVRREKIDGDEFEKLMRGETLPEKEEEAPPQNLNSRKFTQKRIKLLLMGKNRKKSLRSSDG